MSAPPTSPAEGALTEAPLAEAEPSLPRPRGGLSPFRRALLLLALAMVPFFCARLGMLWLTWEEARALSLGQIAEAFVVGLRFDLATYLPFGIGPLGLMALPLCARSERWRLAWGWLAFAPLVPLALLLVADAVYFREVGRHVGREVVLLGHDLGYVFVMARQHLPLCLAFAAGMGLLGFGWHRLLRAPARRSRRPWVLLLVFCALGGLAIRGSVSRKPLHPLDAYREHGFTWGNLTLNGAFSAIRASLHTKSTPRNRLHLPEALAVLGRDGAQDYPFSAAPPAPSPLLPGRPNVIVVLLESWDASVMGCYGAEVSLTPHFDAWAAESRVYDQFYASSQRTIGGVQATLTGVPPLPGLPELGHGLEQAELTRAAARARQEGYQAYFFQGPRRRSYYLDSFALSAGFSEAYGLEDYPPQRDHGDQEAKWGWDEDLYAFVGARLAKSEQPFFAFVLTGTTHSPYVTPEPELVQDPHEAHGVGGYRNTMRYADAALGRFLAQARATPWYKDTVWIVCADHVFRSAREDLRESFRIPLLVHVPGAAPGRDGGLRSQLDVHATLIQALRLPGKVSTLGVSLLGPAPGEALVKQGQILGLVTPEGFLSHTLASPVARAGLSEAQATQSEARILAYQRAVTDLVGRNRWAEAP